MLNLQLKALLSEQNYTLSNLANASSLLWSFLPEQVYTGFYLYNGDKLILGPFQGSVSCVEIVMGKGVCGEAAQTRQTMIVEDVKNTKIIFPVTDMRCLKLWYQWLKMATWWEFLIWTALRLVFMMKLTKNTLKNLLVFYVT